MKSILMKNILASFVTVMAFLFALTAFAADTTAPAAVKADNSGKNVRDQNQARPTADSQAKGSDMDVEVTRMIRQELTKDSSLSMNAHNVKIVTLNNVVTLRGPVNSQLEKDKVAQLAARVASSAQIQNQLEVIRK